MTAPDPILATIDGAPPHSWTPISLADAANLPPLPPTIGGLVYPRRRHVFLGEPESLKTWAAVALCVEEVRAGRHVVHVDAENGAAVMHERFTALGLGPDELARVLYIEPAEPLAGDSEIAADVDRLLREAMPSLVVLDSFDALLGLHGLDPNSTKDVERFWRVVVERLRAHGAAVVILDHVTKDRERRGKFAIGSQRKTSAAEVALGFEVVSPFGRGRAGLARIVTHKDRLGHLRRPRAAELVLQSDGDTGAVEWTFRPSQETGDGHTFRPTKLMERVSRYVEAHVPEEAPSRNAVETHVGKNREYVRIAMDVLRVEGYLEETRGPRKARLLRSLKPYREADDAEAQEDV